MPSDFLEKYASKYTWTKKRSACAETCFFGLQVTKGFPEKQGKEEAIKQNKQ
jgi:hypothetical protein